jgi:Family of unknown function (DUF6146)
MKNLFYLFIILILIISCTTSKQISTDKKVSNKSSDTVRIANDSLEYEVIIIDPGFSSWIAGRSKPRGYYSESYLEGRNRIFVSEWNRRVLQSQVYDPNLYEMQINYNYNVHYGYEVNYLIYNYMIYFQITNKQQLAGFVPRI